MRARPARFSVAADYKFLFQANLNLDPRTTAMSYLVRRVNAFGDQPLDSILFGFLEQRVRIAIKTRRKVNGIGNIFEQCLQNVFAPRERKLLQIAVFNVQNIEHIIAQRARCAAHRMLLVLLQKLKGGMTAFIDGHNFPVENSS